MSKLRRQVERDLAGELDERARCLLAAARSLLKDPIALTKATLMTRDEREARQQLEKWAADLETLAESCQEVRKILDMPTVSEFIELGKLRRAMGLQST